jgi:hypothetical protein
MKLYLQYTIPYVSGDTRKGKSFLLNFLIRYLEAGGSEDWLDQDPEKPLEGFSWRSVILIFIQCCGSGIRDWVLFDPWIRDPE